MEHHGAVLLQNQCGFCISYASYAWLICASFKPQIPDESHLRYLFVAIDRATRWVFMHIYADQSADSSVDFLNRLEQAAPMNIVTLLTDNGGQFTDRFTSKTREPTGRHKLDARCKALNIEHRLCPPRHPQTNGMVERSNARISEVVHQGEYNQLSFDT